MGAKTWMLVYGSGDVSKILKAEPVLDRQATTALVARLFPGEHLVEGADTTLSFTCPNDDEIIAASLGGVVVVAAKECRIERPSTLPSALVNALPGHDVTLHVMHSTVDWFAFATWRGGVLQRSLSLAPDDGILEDIGERLPFEAPYWDGMHPAVDADDPDDDYPFVFHPLELGEAALLALFGYQLEGVDDPSEVAAGDIAVMRFKRKTPWWRFIKGATG